MSIDEHVHDQQGASSDARPAGAPATDLRVGGRRRLLFGGVATAFAAIATACSSDEDTGSSTPSSESTQSGPVSTSSAVTTRDSSTAATGGGTTPATTAGGSDTTTAEGDDGADDGTASSEPGGEEDGATSDGKNQEADVPVREGDADGGRDPNNPTQEELSDELAQDLATIQLAAGLEVLAVNTYRRTSLATVFGALGAVPPAVAEFVITVMGHHRAALDELNRTLLLAGHPAVTTPNAELQPVVDAAFAAVNDVPGAARLALMLEEIAAATYLDAIPKIKSPEAVAFAASVYPIDMQHASVLRFVLGKYPVPKVFGTVKKAASPV